MRVIYDTWDRIYKSSELTVNLGKVVMTAMGKKPSSGYWTFIDGACEVDGQLEVFVSNADDVSCIGPFAVVTYPADAVRLPQTKLPIVFRETSIPCLQWARQIGFQ